MLDWLHGLHTPPWLVGFARGAVEAALMGGWVALCAFALERPELATFAPLILWLERWGEGLIDQVDKTKKRASGTGSPPGFNE